MSIFGIHLIRQMLLENLIQKDIEDYGVLKITKTGESFLKKPTSFKIALNHIYETDMEEDDDSAELVKPERQMKNWFNF